jgi:hypothetical protein
MIGEQKANCQDGEGGGPSAAYTGILQFTYFACDSSLSAFPEAAPIPELVAETSISYEP